MGYHISTNGLHTLKRAVLKLVSYNITLAVFSSTSLSRGKDTFNGVYAFLCIDSVQLFLHRKHTVKTVGIKC
jgi:hypothetical protein